MMDVNEALAASSTRELLEELRARGEAVLAGDPRDGLARLFTRAIRDLLDETPGALLDYRAVGSLSGITTRAQAEIILLVCYPQIVVDGLSDVQAIEAARPIAAAVDRAREKTCQDQATKTTSTRASKTPIPKSIGTMSSISAATTPSATPSLATKITASRTPRQ